MNTRTSSNEYRNSVSKAAVIYTRVLLHVLSISTPLLLLLQLMISYLHSMYHNENVNIKIL